MYFKKDRAIHLVAGITDMRKQINGLAQIANEKKSERVFTGDYFVFLRKEPAK
jgi:transposase